MKSPIHVVLNGSPDFIKGFISGYFKGKGITDEPLFILHEHLNKPGIIEKFLDYFPDRKNTHVIIEKNILSDLQNILSDSSFSIKIISAEPVNSASFELRFKAYSQSLAAELQQILKEIPGEIKIIYSKIQENVRAHSTMLSSTHKYELNTLASIEGEAKSVIELFYRLEPYEIVELGPIKLIT